ncbi:MAG: polysulfide reductase [Chloroflexota bacterium]|nr:MAG: polysulfide reductase [Chloroflexota bacterium]
MIDWRERLVDLARRLAPATDIADSPEAAGYHSLPVLRRPHWKWHIPLYFSISGTASGAYSVAAFADASGRTDDRPIARAGRLIALGGVLATVPLLIDDLGRPERFHHMLRVFKPRSPMSMGAWGLGLFGTFAGILTAIDVLGDRARFPAGLRHAIGMLGMPLSLFLSGYTGVLLAATAVPLWARGRLLFGPLFALSAVGTGLSAIELALSGSIDSHHGARKRLRDLDITILLAELGVTAALPRVLGRFGRPLTVSPWGQPFWFAVAIGQVIPLGLRLASPRADPATGRFCATLAAILTLLGGLMLRWTVVEAGKTSADDPAAAFAFHGQR